MIMILEYHSVEFTLAYYSFDIALDLCSELDIRSKVFRAFNHLVHSRLLIHCRLE